METGRNQLCPCGSGKKHKNCCIERFSKSHTELGNLWSQLHEIDVDLNRRLIEFFGQIHDHSEMDAAWEEFSFNAVEFGMDSPHLQTFMPWFFHEWIPRSRKRGIRSETLAFEYLNRHPDRVSDTERSYILANREIPYSFWEVVACEPSKGFRLKDVLIGAEIDVEEHLGSSNLRTGDMLFCRVVTVDKLSVLNGCGSFPIPPRYKPDVIRMRAELRKVDPRKNRQMLVLWDTAIRRLYWDLVESISTPPKLVNTDGDPMELHELAFDIDSPDEAFDQLKSLCVTQSEEELLQDSKRDRNGRIRRVEFDWTKKGNPINKTWDNTVLGNIRIDGNTLTVSVNSRERAEKIRGVIESRLKNRVRFLTDKVRSTESLMKNAGRSGNPLRKKELEDKELHERPEVREMIRGQMESHWKNWIHEKLRALDNKTPLQAARTKDGREMLEALLLQMERDDEQSRPWMRQKEYIDRVRRELGLG